MCLITVVVGLEIAALTWPRRPQAVDIGAQEWPAGGRPSSAVCSYVIGRAPSMQMTPVLADGMLYISTGATTVATDPITCALRWRVDRPVTQYAWWANSRGVAVTGGLLIRGTPDGELIALDAANGALRWSRQIADGSSGQSLPMPPLVVDSLIVIGPAGSEMAVEGWVGAFRVRDGSAVWRFATIRRDASWLVPAGVVVGGGTTWTPFSYDSAAGTMYVATTNPSPDFAGDVRQGANHYTNSVIALQAHTGVVRWFNQLVPHDVHDWDLTHAGPLVGDTGIIATGKDGIVRLLDRRSGRLLWRTAIVRQVSTTARITRQGIYVCPGVYGGVLWSQPVYDAQSGAVFINAIEYCGTYFLSRRLQHHPPASYMGGEFHPDVTSRSGVLTALSVSTGAVLWRQKTPRPMIAGLALSDGIVYTGDLDGNLLGYRVESGQEVVRIPTGTTIGGGLLAYTIAGQRYLAVAAGHPSAQLAMRDGGPARVMVFALPDP